MINHRKTLWKNRLIRWIPWIVSVSEARRLLQSAVIWRNDGWITPPPFFVRRAMLLSEAREIGARIFVETGTFLGDTTWSFREKFNRIYTVEVEPGLANLARDRFKNNLSISVIEGDSGEQLPNICKEINAPCIFFLDGHYSGGFTGQGRNECPILEELCAIFNHTTFPFRIIIDDARLFGANPTYPSLADIEQFMSTQGTKMRLRVENDAIIIS